MKIQLLKNPPRLAIILIATLAHSALSAGGLHSSDEEIAIWRERAGLDAGEKMYYARGDVQPNSPADFLRVWLDADSAVNVPGNDRYTNYDISQGLDRPITELNSPWIPDNSYPARMPYIDDKEPRPLVHRKDYGAISVMNAGFLHLLLGDEDALSGISGSDYAGAVRDELLWYADNEWLDFSNTARWVRDDTGFGDRNPGFFITCWLNTLVNAYDYTWDSAVYTKEDHAIIRDWLADALDFYLALKLTNMVYIFPEYHEGNYGVVRTGGWPDSMRGAAWTGSAFRSYGFNETFSNRSTVQWRFIMRCGLLLKDDPEQGTLARSAVAAAHRWFKEWVVFGTFKDGTFSDFHRGSRSNPQKGLSYSSIAVGAAIDAVDAYERLMHEEPGFESLYDWHLSNGSAEFEIMVPDSLKARPWYNSFIPGEGESKGFKDVLRTYAMHFDGSFGNERNWGGIPIDGRTEGGSENAEEHNVWLAPASNYFSQTDPELGQYLKSIYTRTADGTSPYSSTSYKAGSYILDIGSWAGHPATLFMFGLMEGKVWPYAPGKKTGNPFQTLESIQDGWKVSPWFDWINDSQYPWVYHLEHAWIYILPSDTPDNFFFIDSSLSWMWCGQQTYPFLYQIESADWLLYLKGSTEPRWFWSLAQASWISEP